MKIKHLSKVIVILASLLLFSCGTKRVVPMTGRTYRVAEGIFSDRQMLEYSKSAYPYYISENGNDSRDQKKVSMVKRVANKLIRAANNYMQNNGYAEELKYFDWEVHLVTSKVPNATCMAGGKILVFEGILPVAENDAGLAAILGHEIGHALAHHSAEQLTKQKKKEMWQAIGAAGVSIAGTVAGGDREAVGQVINQGIGLSNEVMQIFEMKYSRKHELEADRIGMLLMAMAGYDPHEAPKIWTRMTEMYGENTQGILSTHPTNAKRKKEMEEKWMGEAMMYYQSSGNKKQQSATTVLAKDEYRVRASKLNVRSTPSTDASVVGSLSNGQTVKVNGITNGWAKITYNGKTCYIKADYLTK